MTAPQAKSLAEKWTLPPQTELCALPVLAEYPASLTRLESGSGAESGFGDAGDLRATADDIAFDEALLTPFQRLVHTRLEEAACLLSTLIAEEGQLEKAGIVMASLGRKLAGTLMKQLAEDELQKGIQAIAALEHISAEARRDAVDTFQRRLQTGDFSIKGGLVFARGALEYAVGPHKAREILELGQVTHTSSSAYELLKNVAPDQIAPFVSQEHPQTIALILSQLDPPQAAGILGQLPSQLQADVAYRIATMEGITPTVLRQIGESLESSLRDILGGNQDVGGPKVVANILNFTGSTTEKSVLDQVDAQDSKVAEAVRNLMFLFADIVKLSDREIQALLREVDQKDLVVALKGAADELKTKILNNMSERVRSFITQEMEFLGPMRLSEVEEVQLRIVQQVRQLEEQGQLTVVRGDSKDSFV